MTGFRFDHVGFLTADDSTIAWLYDADGTHIELMSPVPADLMVDAHRRGRCANGWVDDWQRYPAVLPRKGDTALQTHRVGSPA